MGQSENLLYLAAKIYADRALKHDLNAMIAITGEMGAGKSSLALKLAEILHEEHGLGFSIDNVYFDLAQFADDLLIKRKHVMIVDEAGVQLYSRNFMTEMNRFIAQIAQMLRFRNDIIIFTLPHVRFLDKTVRILLQHIWRVKIVGDGSGGVKRVAKPYVVFTDYVHDRIEMKPAKYKTKFGGYNEFPWITWSMVSEKLWKEYNSKKESFFRQKIIDNIKNLEEEAEKPTLAEILRRRYIQDEQTREILFSNKKSHEKARIIKHICETYGFSRQSVYRVINQLKREVGEDGQASDS